MYGARALERLFMLQACLRQLSLQTKELAAKAAIKDLNTLLDGKADIDEVCLCPLSSRSFSFSRRALSLAVS